MRLPGLFSSICGFGAAACNYELAFVQDITGFFVWDLSTDVFDAIYKPLIEDLKLVDPASSLGLFLFKDKPLPGIGYVDPNNPRFTDFCFEEVLPLNPAWSSEKFYQSLGHAFPGGGGDPGENQMGALFEAASRTRWASTNSKRILILVTDEEYHTGPSSLHLKAFASAPANTTDTVLCEQYGYPEVLDLKEELEKQRIILVTIIINRPGYQYTDVVRSIYKDLHLKLNQFEELVILTNSTTPYLHENWSKELLPHLNLALNKKYGMCNDEFPTTLMVTTSSTKRTTTTAATTPAVPTVTATASNLTNPSTALATSNPTPSRTSTTQTAHSTGIISTLPLTTMSNLTTSITAKPVSITTTPSTSKTPSTTTTETPTTEVTTTTKTATTAFEQSTIKTTTEWRLFPYHTWSFVVGELTDWHTSPTSFN